MTYGAPFVKILFCLSLLVFELIYNNVCPIYISEISDLYVGSFRLIIYARQNTLLSWNKKRLYIGNFRLIMYDKIHSTLEQKALTK